MLAEISVVPAKKIGRERGVPDHVKLKKEGVFKPFLLYLSVVVLEKETVSEVQQSLHCKEIPTYVCHSHTHTHSLTLTGLLVVVHSLLPALLLLLQVVPLYLHSVSDMITNCHTHTHTHTQCILTSALNFSTSLSRATFSPDSRPASLF